MCMYIKQKISLYVYSRDMLMYFVCKCFSFFPFIYSAYIYIYTHTHTHTHTFMSPICFSYSSKLDQLLMLRDLSLSLSLNLVCIHFLFFCIDFFLPAFSSFYLFFSNFIITEQCGNNSFVLFIQLYYLFIFFVIC